MRQLIVLCDGTNNNLTGGQQDTHVVTLVELLRAHHDAERLVFYDPGVGNPGEVPGTTPWDQLKRRYERLQGLAFGWGVFDNIAEGYRFLMEQWRGDDEIYIFGFSRGAFTARCIAALVTRYGILPPEHGSMIPTLLQLYFSDAVDDVDALAGETSRAHANGARITAQIRRLFVPGRERRPFVHFVGVWDTVATVGLWPLDLKMHARPTLAGKRFVHVRHALALDEQRAQFAPRGYAEDNGVVALADGRQGTVQQMWFRGAHCDIGGGYPDERAALSRVPLCWLVSQAVSCGLRLHQNGQPLADEARVAAALDTLPVVRSQPWSPVVNSQTRANAWWAVTGLAWRNPRQVHVDGRGGMPARMAEHPSVAAWDARFPQDTTWREPGPRLGFVVAALVCLVWPLLLGQLLHGGPPEEAGVNASLAQAWSEAGAYLQANGRLQRWQLGAMFEPRAQWWATVEGFHSPRWAMVWDVGFIAAYGYLLARWASHAFARACGLNRMHLQAPRRLTLLGWALPVAMAADLLENVAGIGAISLGHAQAWMLAELSLVVLCIASALKWAGLAGVAMLGLGWRAMRVQPASPG